MGKNGPNRCRQQRENTSKIFSRRNTVVSNTLPCSHAWQHQESVWKGARHPAHFYVVFTGASDCAVTAQWRPRPEVAAPKAPWESTQWVS